MGGIFWIQTMERHTAVSSPSPKMAKNFTSEGILDFPSLDEPKRG